MQLQVSPQLHPWPQLHVVAAASLHEEPHWQAGPQLQAVFLSSVFTGISMVGLN